MNNKSLLAWLWLAVALLLALAVWRWSATPGAVNSNILALLPAPPHADLIGQAQERLADNAARRLVLLVGGGELDVTLRAGDAVHAALQKNRAFARIDYRLDPARLTAMRAFHNRHHSALLTASQRAALQTDNAEPFLQQALQNAYSPFGGGLSFKEDPFGFFADWQREQAALSRLRPIQDRLVATEGDKHYVALFLELQGSAFDAEVQERVAHALDAARHTAGKAEFLSAGVVNFATAVQRQAQREVSLISSGSLIGIALLILAAFGSLRPLFLTVLPIVIGCLAAIAACYWLFGGIHILTLVFGASLVGVSVDYGLHFLCHLRHDDDAAQKFSRLHALLPGLTLAMATSVLAYLTLAIPDFPGLRQMAVFSGVGLMFALVTTLLWLPRLAHAGLKPQALLPRVLVRLRDKITRLTRPDALLLGAAMLVVTLGLVRLGTNDDVRILQTMPTHLLAEQQRVATLAGVASPGQFLLVQATTPETLLQTEEKLRIALDALPRTTLENYQAISRWVPSAQRQMEDRKLIKQYVLGEAGWLVRLADMLEFKRDDLQAYAAAPAIQLGQWLASPASEAHRHLWLGRMGEYYASVITLQGIGSTQAVRDVVRATHGVTWVDRTSDISRLLGDYRREMSWVAGLGYVLVFLALVWRYRRQAWRAIAPTVFSTLLTLGLMGWLSIPVNLFTVLALLLVLGVGIDYGIYMQEEDRNNDTWIGISLSALTTLFSFGLLALSQTPALFSLGLTMLFGVSLAWLLSAVFARDNGHTST